MSGRSSRRSLALLLVVACGGEKKPPPPKLEIDPAKVLPVAQAIYQNAPSFGSARDCTDADFPPGGMMLTQVSLRAIIKKPPDNEAPHRAWINPTEYDDPAVRTLVAGATDPHLVRQAAWAFLKAPYYVLYRVDQVNAPIALNIKELIRGTVEVRMLRHERNGANTCTKVIYFQNDKAKSDAAIAVSDQAELDPAVVKAMQDDLHDQFMLKIPRIPPAPPPLEQ